MLIGIDLGTTNSLAAIWRDGETVLVPNVLGHRLTPSAVGIGDDGEVLVGLAARERLVSHPGLTAAAFKRLMGTNRELTLGKKRFRPEELSALVLRSLKADAEAFLGEPVREAIITVPAYFNEPQRRATTAAGELAGLAVRRLVSEPTAAALAHGLQDAVEEEHFVVVDLGGGTFDVSVLQRFEGVIEVRAAAGDSQLGGEDFVDAIVAEARARHRDALKHAPAAVEAALRRQAEQAKLRLSEADRATLSVSVDGRSLDWTLTRAEFESAAQPLLSRIRAPIERALRDARLPPDAVAKVVLAGGASRMPMFRRLIARLFQRLPVQLVDPDEVVARGAAVQAGLVARDAALGELVMTDVAPFSLGVEVAHEEPDGRLIPGFFLPLIERNTVIPASRAERLFTTRDRQRAMSVKVYQGESRLAAENIFLGELEVAVPPAPAGREAVDIRFSYDSSSLLEVEATVTSTGKLSRLVIEGNPGRLSPAEIAERLARLAALKVPPREQAENAALLARAGRLYEERTGPERTRIGAWIATFTAVLERQDPREIADARRALGRALDGIDTDLLPR
jgi:molecular chaperone HscC